MIISKRIGIIGLGFVGSAVRYGFSPNVGCDAEIKVYDKDPNKSTHTLDEVVNQSDIIFMSVPTPSNKDGSINLDIVDSVLKGVNSISNKDSIVIVRSTVIPGTTRNFQSKFNNLKLGQPILILLIRQDLYLVVIRKM